MFVSPPLYVEALMPNVVVWSWGLWRVIRVRRGYDGINILMQETPAAHKGSGSTQQESGLVTYNPKRRGFSMKPVLVASWTSPLQIYEK
jgi:hypothetical protein